MADFNHKSTALLRSIQFKIRPNTLSLCVHWSSRFAKEKEFQGQTWFSSLEPKTLIFNDWERPVMTILLKGLADQGSEGSGSHTIHLVERSKTERWPDWNPGRHRRRDLGRFSVSSCEPVQSNEEDEDRIILERSCHSYFVVSKQNMTIAVIIRIRLRETQEKLIGRYPKHTDT